MKAYFIFLLFCSLFYFSLAILLKEEFPLKIGVCEIYLVEITKKFIGYLVKSSASPADAQDSLLKRLEIEEIIPPK